MEPAREIVHGRHLATVAVWVEDTRLIDNTEL
jgi:pantothenate synthetase